MTQLSTQDIVNRSWHETLVVGHRGAADYKPENTIPAFQEAIKSGAVAAECDVHVSKDGELMVIHDSTLDRTTSLKGLVANHQSKEMQAVGVPTLKQYLKTTKGKVLSVVEVKGGVDVVKKTVEAIRKEKMVGQTVIFSFNSGYVLEAKKVEPKLFTVWLQSNPKDLAAHFEKCKEIQVDAVGVSYEGASCELVQAAHERKMPVFVWTVPPGEIVDRLKALKVNFIITNSPRHVVEQLK